MDLENELNGTVFMPLKDKSKFMKFSIVFNTIEWENGADFAPEYLYDLAIQHQKVYCYRCSFVMKKLVTSIFVKLFVVD